MRTLRKMRICTGHNEELMNMRQTRAEGYEDGEAAGMIKGEADRKSTRLNSSHP